MLMSLAVAFCVGCERWFVGWDGASSSHAVGGSGRKAGGEGGGPLEV